MKEAFQRLFWRNYRQTWALRERFRRRFSAAGMLVLSVMAVCGGLGLDTNLNLAYQAFSFFAVLLCVSMVFSLGKLPKLSARRELPRLATAGTPIEYSIHIRNEGKQVERGYRVAEIPEDPRPPVELFLKAREPNEAQRNPFDRLLAYYRWMWLIARRTLMRSFESNVPDAAPGEEVEVKASLLPLRRGRLDLKGLSIACPDPLGLYRTFLQIPCPGRLLILPKRYPLNPRPLLGNSQYQQGGVALASSVGESEEFMALRDYRRGDPPRRIHWKSLSKTGRLIVKEYQDEFFVRQGLILDTFGSKLKDDSVFEEAVSIASSLALAVETKDSLLDLMFVGRQAYCFTAGRGVGQVEQMLEILAAVEISPEESVEGLRRLVLEHISSLSACWCVLLSWDEERRDFIQEIRAYGIPLKVLVVTSEERKAEESADWLHFIPVKRAVEALRKI